VDLPLGQPAHKKIAYCNPWESTRYYTVSSSDDGVMKPRYTRLEIPPQDKAYIRVGEGRGGVPSVEEEREEGGG